MKTRLQLVRLAAAILIGSMLVCAVSCGIGIVSGKAVFLAVGAVAFVIGVWAGITLAVTLAAAKRARAPHAS
jgi:hypothetical protein